MVDQITSSISTIPLSLRRCFTKGEVDVHRKMSSLLILDYVLKKTRKRTNVEMDSKVIKYCTPRSMKRHKQSYRDSNGNLKEHTTSIILWCLLHVN